jgi:HAMP domain-containing protein
VLVVEPGWAAANAIKLAAIIAAGAVLVLGLSGLLIGRALASRINSLSEAVGRMSVGELSTTVKDISANGSRPADEIGRLADQLEQMRESFRQAIERLRKR